MTGLIERFPIHEASLLFPAMDEESLQALADDIKKNGLLEPIILYEEKVLDGRNRLAACELAGVEPHFTSTEVSSPVLYVVSKNLHRRHLTIGQRAAIGAEMLPILQTEAAKRQQLGLKNQQDTSSGSTEHDESGRSCEIAAKAVDVSSASIKRAARAKRDHPELYEKVKRGELSVRTASDGKSGGVVHMPRSHRGIRKDKSADYDPKTERQRELAEAQKNKMVRSLSEVHGHCRGLLELDVPMACSVCSKEEIRTWSKISGEVSKQLRRFSAWLEKERSKPHGGNHQAGENESSKGSGG